MPDPHPEPAARLVTRFETTSADAAVRLRERLHQTAQSVRDEPGHLDYRVAEDLSDPAVVYVDETWASAADGRRHEELVMRNGAAEAIAPLMRTGAVTWRLRASAGSPRAEGGAR